MQHDVRPDPKNGGKWAVYLGDDCVEDDLASEGEARQVADMMDAMAA